MSFSFNIKWPDEVNPELSVYPTKDGYEFVNENEHNLIFTLSEDKVRNRSSDLSHLTDSQLEQVEILRSNLNQHQPGYVQ